MQLISVIMPVYNSASFIDEAVKSILNQYKSDFEFIIIDDGSTDESIQIINKIKDKRVIQIINSSNLGLSASLNLGIRCAKGKYIIRMDADDISKPERIQNQLAFMEQHQDVVISGTARILLYEDGQQLIHQDMYTEPDEIKCRLLFGNCLAHPTVIIKKDFLELNNLQYNPIFKYAQDYELWCRASICGKLANLKSPLLIYRHHNAQIANKNYSEQERYADLVRKEHLERLGLNFTERELLIHNCFSKSTRTNDNQFDRDLDCWLKKIKNHNKQHNIFNQKKFEEVIEAKLAHYANVNHKNLVSYNFRKYLKRFKKDHFNQHENHG